LLGVCGAAGAFDGRASLWLDGILKQTLTGIDNDTMALDSVRLGATGVDTGTRGTIHFDDYDSRRFSEIGLLPDPGISNPTPTPPPTGWTNASYAYGNPDHIHAVTAVTDDTATDTYTYDANGNMTCRAEGGQVFVQTYNAENRMAGVTRVSGTCASWGNVLATWAFTYDGDGSRVKQALRQAQD
jgi:YD repeat-containing protein